MPPVAPSREEVLNQLSEIVKTRTDALRVKVWLRAKLGGHPELVLSVHDARLSHVADPETWIPRLIGGSGPDPAGTFTLEVAHEDAPALVIGRIADVRIGGKIRKDDGGAIKVDWSAIDDAECGAYGLRVVHPPRPEAPMGAVGNLWEIGRGAGAPGAPAVLAPAAAPAAPHGSVAEDVLARERAARRQEDENTRRAHEIDLEAQKRQFEIEQQRTRAEFKAEIGKLTDTVARVTAAPAVAAVPPAVSAELEAIRRELADTRVREAEARGRADAMAKMPPPAAPVAVAPPPSPIAAFLTPDFLMGALDKLVTFAKDSRTEQIALAKEARETAAAASKEARDAQAAASKELREIMVAQKADPAHTKLMETLAGVQAQSFTQMSNLMDLNVRLIRDLGGDEKDDESPWLKLGREVLGFLGSTQASEANLQRDLAAIAAHGAGGGALPEGAPGAEAGAGPGAGPAAADYPPDSKSLTQIKALVMGMRSPDEVASLVINALENDPDFREEVEDAGELQNLFEEHFGEWLEQDPSKREAYAAGVFQAIVKLAKARRTVIGKRNGAPKAAAPPPPPPAGAPPKPA